MPAAGDGGAAERGPRRARPLPPHVVADRPAGAAYGAADEDEARLHARLSAALAALPDAERTAVVAAIGYDGGAVGAAMELGLDLDGGLADADAVTRNALQLLRGALDDLDAHGRPRG